MGHLVMERVLDWSAWTEPPRVGFEGVPRDERREKTAPPKPRRSLRARVRPPAAAVAVAPEPAGWDAARLPPVAPRAPGIVGHLLQRNYRGAIGFVAVGALVAAAATAVATRGRLEDMHRFPVPRLPASSTVSTARLAAVPPMSAVPAVDVSGGTGTASDERARLSLKLAASIDESAIAARLEPAPRAAPTTPVPVAVDSPLAVVAPTAMPVEVPSPAGEPVIERRDHGITPEERADTAFRVGTMARRNGDVRVAEARFTEALALVPAHVSARQALGSLLLDARRMDDLESVLRDGIRHSPSHVAFSMAVARLEAERGDLIAAVVTLERALKSGGEHSGEFLALQGALLQRLDRHSEAVERYGAAIALGAANPVWFLGQAVSLRETGRMREARVRFQRALDSRSLAPELRVYAEKQLSLLGAS